MNEENEIVLTSVAQFGKYLKETADGGTIVSVVLELTGMQMGEGSGVDG